MWKNPVARYLQFTRLVLNAIKIVVITSVMLFGYDFSFPKEEGDVFVPIAKYIIKGDVDSLSAWFDDNLLIAVTSRPNTASKDQSKRVVKAFFDTHTPQSFVINHVAERGNVKYALGRLEAGGGVYSVTILVSSKGEAYKIQQFKIEQAPVHYMRVRQ